MAKKKSMKGLGARYGIKPRKQYTQVHLMLKEKRTCPDCGSKKLSREAVGIWKCQKCGFKIAGTAYDVKL
ncbi:50S ribosomal protein L37 [Nitrosopumilus sp. b1]|uniref:transposase n=1 Tax=Nitrosopumilus sp. b1 TaxID=2109907 RepID=UPI0015F5DA38|nr:transposase [Nitrosopumilus sp. b1]KAF6243214.1 50S ribosomal protein L37 [Nitrosopumilus sp. b1]